MKSVFFSIALFMFSIVNVMAQRANIDSLKKIHFALQNDTLTLLSYENIAEAYTEINPDSSFYYAGLAQSAAAKIKLPLEEIYAWGKMGYALMNKGNYSRTLKNFLAAVAIAQNPINEKNILGKHYPSPDEFINRNMSPGFQRMDNLAHIYQYMGILYGNSNNHEKALHYTHLALQLLQQTQNIKLTCITNSSLGRFYLLVNKADSALLAQQKAYNLAIQDNYPRYLGSIFLNTGRVYLSKGDTEKAAEFFRKAIAASREYNYNRGVVAAGLMLANYYSQAGKKDSSLHHIQSALATASGMNAPDLLLRCYNSLAQYYKAGNRSDSVVKYLELGIKINDSIFNAKQVQQFQNIDFDEQQRMLELEKETEKIKNRNRTYLMLTGLAAFFVIALVLYRGIVQRNKANRKLEKTLSELQATQTQLIHSEKMASLGELTAGIAHEIQNPLNFVNNFSEVSNELIDEMKEELDNGNYDEAKEIANDVKQNLEKITNHGKRADAIVKGMLQHSRSSSGHKEPTDINALCDEYLRLSYHGLRAKDKTFNAKFETNFDSRVGKINVVPQDIGRVILNLINNAFYTVNEKKKTISESYEPTVIVSTKNENNRIIISVADNGNGITDAIKEKIFQPFFTTKPTGQGTGLGLSLSYDIVKAHGGELKVETKENEGTTFAISLPVS